MSEKTNGLTEKGATLCEFSMFPLDKGASVSQYVARIVRVIDESGLEYRFGPMSTTIEGSYEEVMDVVRRCFEVMQTESDRVVLHLRLDYRRGRRDSMKTKMRSVESKVGHELSKKKNAIISSGYTELGDEPYQHEKCDHRKNGG